MVGASEWLLVYIFLISSAGRPMNEILPKAAPPGELAQIANHLFFIVALLFVAHQNALHAEAPAQHTAFIAQAINLQPRTPPPGFDPEQVSSETDFANAD